MRPPQPSTSPPRFPHRPRRLSGKSRRRTRYGQAITARRASRAVRRGALARHGHVEVFPPARPITYLAQRLPPGIEQVTLCICPGSRCQRTRPKIFSVRSIASSTAAFTGRARLARAEGPTSRRSSLPPHAAIRYLPGLTSLHSYTAARGRHRAILGRRGARRDGRPVDIPSVVPRGVRP